METVNSTKKEKKEKKSRNERTKRMRKKSRLKTNTKTMLFGSRTQHAVAEE